MNPDDIIYEPIAPKLPQMCQCGFPNKCCFSFEREDCFVVQMMQNAYGISDHAELYKRMVKEYDDNVPFV